MIIIANSLGGSDVPSAVSDVSDEPRSYRNVTRSGQTMAS
jgi:hypothetical protein